MKRLISILILAVIALTAYGCKSELIDYNWRTEYIYKNECLRTIIVSSYSPNYEDQSRSRDSVFTIESGKEFYVKFYHVANFLEPLDWYVHSRTDRDNDYTVVSNGISEFIHYHKNGDPLYSLDEYELVTDEILLRTYVYTFRDEDFE